MQFVGEGCIGTRQRERARGAQSRGLERPSGRRGDASDWKEASGRREDKRSERSGEQRGGDECLIDDVQRKARAEWLCHKWRAPPNRGSAADDAIAARPKRKGHARRVLWVLQNTTVNTGVQIVSLRDNSVFDEVKKSFVKIVGLRAIKL